MPVNKGEMFYEGKAKKLYRTADPQILVQEFKDSLTAFNAQKKGSFQNKGVINRQITTIIFEYLRGRGIPTHFVELQGERDMVIRALKIFPLEIVVRNTVTGSLMKRLGLKEGDDLNRPIVEFYFKNDALGDPIVTEDHIEIMGLASASEVKELKALGLKINEHLKVFFEGVGLKLVDFKVEAGKDSQGQVLLGDEITPDSCRLWDLKTGEKMDKDRFRQDLGKVEETYKEVCERIIQKWGKAVK